MTDLTVLIAPNNLYPVSKSAFAFGLSAGRGRRSPGPVPRPVMVTLESDIESPPGYEDTNSGQPQIAAPVPRGLPQDTTLLSPPINTFKAPRPRPRHRPTRSRSAPPGFSISPEQPVADIGQRALDDLSPPPLTAPFLPRPRRQSTFTRPRAGELVKPPPPLLRPTTFWRKTRRSGVTGASYSPASHLVRRSTFIAAGLEFDAPGHDLSAFGVESRVGFILLPPNHIF
ncbi:hypothetical protein EYR40_002627 [Pleurotus pulmonarius]|nr:hypothetical protein EYR36_001947 [Pleurotus pulmonarius]KAF4582703.1 hypothetical protein EYR40_002627 [Pleurotus pulmonarius]KAF4588301.1 hypothetical protein EYR38_010268 [Pleurotus pulmonarius]